MSVRTAQVPTEEFNAKRRKIQSLSKDTPTTSASNGKSTSSDSDVIDPVEKLLSFANRNDNFFSVEESDSELYETPEPASSTRIKGMMDANLKLYYSQLNHRQRHEGTSSFASLNDEASTSNHQSGEVAKCAESYPVVPFFRTVNFNPTKKKAYEFDDYLSYPDLEQDDNVSDSLDQQTSDTESIKTPTLKFNTLDNQNMSFHYRHYDNLNLSLNASTQPEKLDIFKAMNKRCILSGKASEIVSTGHLLINDFYL